MFCAQDVARNRQFFNHFCGYQAGLSHHHSGPVSVLEAFSAAAREILFQYDSQHSRTRVRNPPGASQISQSSTPRTFSAMSPPCAQPQAPGPLPRYLLPLLPQSHQLPPCALSFRAHSYLRVLLLLLQCPLIDEAPSFKHPKWDNTPICLLSFMSHGMVWHTVCLASYLFFFPLRM